MYWMVLLVIPVCKEAADRIEELEAENKNLRAENEDLKQCCAELMGGMISFMQEGQDK